MQEPRKRLLRGSSFVPTRRKRKRRVRRTQEEAGPLPSTALRAGVMTRLEWFAGETKCYILWSLMGSTP